MDQFPNGFNIVTCLEQLRINQLELLKTTRKDIYNTVIEAVEKCSSQVDIYFPINLSYPNRYLIARELLIRFQNITVKTSPSAGNLVKKVIHTDADVPQQIEGIILTFSLS